jgi:hypothetical protein
MRAAYAHHRRQFDVVISCDKSIPHLLSDEEILTAFRQMRDCSRPGGGCLVTVRDYDREERGTGLVKPHGVRVRDGKRYVIFQVWDFAGDIYNLAMYFGAEDDGRYVRCGRWVRCLAAADASMTRTAGFMLKSGIEGADLRMGTSHRSAISSTDTACEESWTTNAAWNHRSANHCIELRV